MASRRGDDDDVQSSSTESHQKGYGYVTAPARQGGGLLWRASLCLAAILAAQENHHHYASAFQPHAFSRARIISSRSGVDKSPSILSVTASPSVYASSITEEARSSLLSSSSSRRYTAAGGGRRRGVGGHDRISMTTATATAAATARTVSSPTMTNQNAPSRMFITSLPRALQQQPALASLSSDFYTSTSSTTNNIHNRRLENTNNDDVMSSVRRTRGVLGFAIYPDHGDQLISSSRQPPSMKESSTNLHSSTEEHQDQKQQQQQRQQRQSLFSRRQSKLDSVSWNLPKTIDEEWITSSSSPFGSPILNGSPNNHLEYINRAAADAADAATKGDVPAWFPWMPTITQINVLTVRELKMSCSQRGLKQVRSLDVVEFTFLACILRPAS